MADMNKKKKISSFQMKWKFFDDTRETEISMLIDGQNVLSFRKDGQVHSTRWQLDELAFWLRDFVEAAKDSPFPFDVKGEFAAQKDYNARDFDTDDETEFDRYYDALERWDIKHRWHTASNSAILADVYFQKIGDTVEISWNNTDSENNVEFVFGFGGAVVSEDDFVSEVETFLNDYADHWFNS